MQEQSDSGPLSGITVIEMGQLIAGPFCGQMLAWFGATVIKIEAPGKGDPLRSWREIDTDGTSFWWRSQARNKHSVTIDLGQQAGRDIVSDLLAKADVLIENFRPGKMESWGFGPDQLKELNPRLVMTRVSGYGQSGPLRTKPGFASACEAMGGFRYLNGFPDRPPVRPNLSLGDTLAGMHAVIGTLLALYNRDRSDSDAASSAGTGQVVDVSIMESVFNMLEGVVPEYSGAGVVREPSGSTLTGIVPTNTYKCRDGKYVVIGGNGDSIFNRLMKAAGRIDLADDPRLRHNPGRVEHEKEIDAVLQEWAALHDSPQLLALLEAAEVPSGPIYSVADMFEDEHYQARGLFEEVSYAAPTADNSDNQRSLVMPSMHPRLADTPGSNRWAGQELGADTKAILHRFLGLSDEQLHKLESTGVI